MDDMHIVWHMMCDLWQTYKKYCGSPMDDVRWQGFIDAGEKFCKKYSTVGKNYESLFRAFYIAFQGHLEKIGRTKS